MIWPQLCIQKLSILLKILWDDHSIYYYVFICFILTKIVHMKVYHLLVDACTSSNKGFPLSFLIALYAPEFQLSSEPVIWHCRNSDQEAAVALERSGKAAEAMPKRSAEYVSRLALNYAANDTISQVISSIDIAKTILQTNYEFI